MEVVDFGVDSSDFKFQVEYFFFEACCLISAAWVCVSMADDDADPTNSFMVVRINSLTDVSVSGEMLLATVQPNDADVVVVEGNKYFA